MKTPKPFIACATTAALMFACVATSAQVVVNDKNLNDDESLEYIQLMYLIDKATLKPVFFVDYGIIEPEYNEILKPKDYKEQRIVINDVPLNDRITVVWVLNQMHKAGWEYMGDVVYVPIPMMDNWHIFTLRRSASRP